jgi:hypothetical protein
MLSPSNHHRIPEVLPHNERDKIDQVKDIELNEDNDVLEIARKRDNENLYWLVKEDMVNC